MSSRQRIAAILFGATLLGALAPSFVHVSEWWLAMVPATMPWLAWVAALVIEGSLFAALFGLTVVKPGMRGRRWVVALLLLGAVASVYANLAWSIRQRGMGAAEVLAWADMLFGAALLPVYAVVTAHAVPHVWARCIDAPTAPKRNAPARGTASPTARPALAPASPERKPSKADAIAMIKAGEFNHAETQADLARALGVSQSSVSRWPVKRNGAGWEVEA